MLVASVVVVAVLCCCVIVAVQLLIRWWAEAHTDLKVPSAPSICFKKLSG